MDAAKAGYRLPTRPSDGFRMRRADETRSSSSIPRSMARPNQTEKASSNHARSNTLPPGSPDRGVSSPPQRRLSNIPRVLKPAPDRQLKLAEESITPSTSIPNSQQAQSDAAFASPARPCEGIAIAGLQQHAEDEFCGTGISPDPSSAFQSPSSRPSASKLERLGIEYDRQLTESPQRLREHETSPRQVSLCTSRYPELDRYRNLQQPLHLSIPRLSPSPDFSFHTAMSFPLSTNSSQLSASSLSMSSRLFDTPGPSTYSRDTTPTSIASQSPNLAASSRNLQLSKHRIQSPSLSRPPISQRRTSSICSETATMSAEPHGLAAVKESLTSSSASISSVPGKHENSDGAQKFEMDSDPTSLGSPLSPCQQSTRSIDHRRSNDAAPQLRRQSQRLSKPEATSATKRSSISKPSTIQSPKPARPSQGDRDSALDEQSQGKTICSNPPSSPPVVPPRSNRRSSEPGVTDSVKLSSRAVPIKSLSMDHGSSTKRNDPLIRSVAGASKESLATTLSLRSGTPNNDAQRSSTNRFQFFGFRKRSSTTSQGEKGPTPSRKGPAAGTGHEGYGTGRTLRRQSASLNGLTTRNPSANSVSSDRSTPVDKFLADRMNPVIIAGGTVIQNQNLISDALKPRCDTRHTGERPSTESKVDSVISSLSRTDAQTTGRPTPSPGPELGLTSRRPSDSSEVVPKPATSLRRTVQRFKSSSSDNPLRLPHVRSKESTELTRMQSCNISIVSEASSVIDTTSARQKRDRTHRKWNLFGRSRNKSTPEIKSEQVSVTVMPAEKKPIAFYAIMDPADEEGEPMDVQTALREARVYTQPSSSFSGCVSKTADPLPQSMHPSPAIIDPPFHPQKETGAGSSAPAPTGSNFSRKGRLIRVGRIPPVVSSRADTTVPPFVFPTPSPQGPAPGQDEDARSEALANCELSKLPASPPTTNTDGSILANFSASDLLNDRSAEPPVKEFLSFSPREKSDCTTYSSSTDSGQFSFAATAVIPKPDDPYAEDEIWDEYNDLLGFDSARGPRSATSSNGVPFHLEADNIASAQRGSARLSTAWPLGRGDWVLPALPEGVAPLSDVSPRDTCLPAPAVLQHQLSPDAAAGVQDLAQAFPSSKPGALPFQTTRESGSSTSSEEWTPSAQVNLRIGSMTVSKWLTFSHILFSDIRHELTREADAFQQPSILVIDGLGNDDWSYYAAESYPDATIFNLSPREPPPDPKDVASSSCLRPPNHHQIQYLSHLDKFPFGSHSFNCVVFRFPAAAPESHFQNIILESRRVLKPEGFIEMSILDLDLNSVGHRARKAIRQLKEKIHERSPETNLASTADVIVRLLGKAGFSSIRAARVGVPVASSISRSSVDGVVPKSSHLAGRQGKRKVEKVKVGDQPSLQEMITRDGPAADENITSMVARVGRWWYSRCYEDIRQRPTADAPRKSIWNDRALLRECEELGTSLKLMVCCARSPERTKSF